MRKMKKCLALLMVLCMIVTIVPLDTFASETVNDITENNANVDESIIEEESTEDSEKIEKDVDKIVEEQELDNESSTETKVEETMESEDTEVIEVVNESEDAKIIEEDAVDTEIDEMGEKQISLEVSDIYVSRVANANTIANSEEFHKILHLDCGRKYFTKEWIIALINEMKAAGYTQLQLAFGNDGLRFLLDDMEFSANGIVYEHTMVVSKIEAGNVAQNDSNDSRWLTQGEMDSIIAHANSKGIEIVPLLNLPGHANAILDIVNDTYNASGSNNTLDVANSEAAQEFGLAIFEKYVDYFAGKGCRYFNFGADEYANDAKTGSFSFSRLSDAEYGEFVEFIGEMSAYIEAKGMTARAFNDGLYYAGKSATIDTDIQCCYWSSGWGSYPVASAETIASKGHKMINTHGDYYYVLKTDGTIQDPINMTSHFQNNVFMGGTISNSIGSMFCIWCDNPSLATEEEVAADVRLTLRKMAAAMQGSASYSEEVIEGGFNTDGSIYEVEENTKDIIVDDDNNAIDSVEMKTGDVSSYNLNISDIQTVNINSDNETVATAVIDLQNKKISINAKSAGIATITVVATSNSRVVADETTDQIIVTVSDRSIEAPVGGTVSSSGSGTGYVMDTDGLDNGAKYVIVYQESESSVSGKALGSDLKPHDVSINGDKVIAGVNDSTMLWDFNIGDYSDILINNGKYLSLYDGLALLPNGWAITIRIERTDSGYKVKDTMWYLNYNGSGFEGKMDYSGASISPLYFYKYTEGAGASYAVATSELSNLINELNDLSNSDYTTASWNVFESALNTANTVLNSVQDSYADESEAIVKQTEVNNSATALYNAYLALIEADVTITVNYVDAQSNVLTTEVFKYVSGENYNIAVKSFVTAGNKNYTPENMSPLTGTVSSDLTLTVLCSENEALPDDALTADSLTIEYWITNARVYNEKNGQGVNQYVINKMDTNVQSTTGVVIKEKVSQNGYKSDNAEKILVPWKIRMLDRSSEEQTSADGIDRTQDGFEACYIRYYNGAWQYSEQGDIWTYVTQNTQVVAYYMANTKFASEVNVSTVDWGFQDSQDAYYFTPCSLSVQVVYLDGTVAPSNDEGSNYPNEAITAAFNPYTEIFGFWSGGRGIGNIVIEETAQYEVWKVTAETGTLSMSNNTNITGFSWDSNETTVWEGESNGNDITIYNHAQNPLNDGYYSNLMWSEANDSILLRIYVKRVYNQDNLHVYYREGTPDSYVDIYSYDIAISEQFTPNTFENVSVTESATDGSLALDNHIIKDYENKDRIIQYDISRMIEVSDKYSSGYYKFTRMEKSDDNKSLYLYYTVDIHQPTFVVDYGLPLVITAEALEIEDLNNISSVTMTGATYGTLKVADDYQTATYTLTKMMEGREVINVTLNYRDGSKSDPFTIILIPATTVYYEDSFVKFNNSTTPNATMNRGIWTTETDENIIANATQSLDKVVEDNSGETSSIYGYDAAYDNYSKFSMGSAQKVIVDSTTGKYGKGCPSAEFTFRGTGFDVISLTDSDSGMIRVTLTNAETNEKVKKPFVISNYYESGTLYQIPVVRVTDLPFAKYHVLIETSYSSSFDINKDSRWSFWMDAVRIYDPAGNVFNAEYTKDGEQEPDFIEIRDILLNAGELNIDNPDTGVVFIDGNQVAGFENYVSNGPKNEVYLAKGQAVAFKLIATSTSAPKNVQIGAKLVSGVSADLYLNGTKLTTLNSATDRNYKLTGITWSEQTDGQWESGIITLSNNTEGAIVSLTNLKAANIEFVLSNTVVETVEESGTYKVSKSRMMVMASSAVLEGAMEILANTGQSKEEDVPTENMKPSDDEKENGTSNGTKEESADTGKVDDTSNASKEENVPENFPVVPSPDKETGKVEDNLVADNVPDENSNGGIEISNKEITDESSSEEIIQDKEDNVSESQETVDNNEDESKTIIQIIVEFVVDIVKMFVDTIGSLFQKLFPTGI